MCFAASPSSCVFRAQLRQCSTAWFTLLQTFKQPFIFLQEVDFQGGFDSQLTERVGAKLFFEKQTADIYCADSHNILAACAPCGNPFTTIIYKTQTLSPSSHYPAGSRMRRGGARSGVVPAQDAAHQGHAGARMGRPRAARTHREGPVAAPTTPTQQPHAATSHEIPQRVPVG